MEKFIKQFSFIALENIFRELPNKIVGGKIKCNHRKIK